MDTRSVAPVRASERLKSLDTLRGFALLGILVPNIVAFAWPSAVMKIPALMGPGDANELGYAITSTVFLSKFRFLFAMLFGAGVIVYARKYDEGEQSGGIARGAGLWYRRCAILLGFGLIHAYLFWYGDILAWYAVAGLTLLWWVRRLPITWQLAGAIASFVFGMLLLFAFLGLMYWGYREGEVTVEEMVGSNPLLEILIYQQGTWSDAFEHRFGTTIFLHLVVVPIYMPVLWGIMMLGMVLMRSKILSGAKSAAWYLTTGTIGVLIGGALTGIWFVWAEGIEDPGMVLIKSFVVEPIGVPLALGYAMLVIAMTKTSVLNFITTPLAAVGRMALTNYFLHTLLCTWFFYGYGWGLGYFGKIQYPQLWMVVGGVWMINIVFSMIWLKFFRFGPVEWAWRCMTYGKLIGILHKPTTSGHG